MTTSQVDNRNKKANLQRRKKKVDTQREIERRDRTTIKEQKSNLDSWLYTSLLLFPGNPATLELPRSSCYLNRPFLVKLVLVHFSSLQLSP